MPKQSPTAPLATPLRAWVSRADVTVNLAEIEASLKAGETKASIWRALFSAKKVRCGYNAFVRRLNNVLAITVDKGPCTPQLGAAASATVPQPPGPPTPESSRPYDHGATPFRLNLHVRDTGHAIVWGPIGTGKSALLGKLVGRVVLGSSQADGALVENPSLETCSACGCSLPVRRVTLSRDVEITTVETDGVTEWLATDVIDSVCLESYCEACGADAALLELQRRGLVPLHTQPDPPTPLCSKCQARFIDEDQAHVVYNVALEDWKELDVQPLELLHRAPVCSACEWP